MECFRLLLEHLSWFEHQFLSGIRDSRKPGSLWGMMRGAGGVRKSLHQSWLAKGLGLSIGLRCWGFKRVQERFLGKRPALFKSVQWDFQQDNAPVHNSILVTDYLTKMGIKTVLQPPYSPDIPPLFNDPCTYSIFNVVELKINKNATETTKKISCVYGQSVITDQVPNWFSKFRSGDTSMRGEYWPGCSSLSKCFKRFGGMESTQKILEH